MRNTRMMIRFLDLTLLLLMAFLLQADLAIERAVGLPRGDASNVSTSSNAFMLYVLPQSWEVSQSGTEICSGEESRGLKACLLQRVTSSSTVRIVPERGVRVQRLVEMLDLCSTTLAECSVGGKS